MNIRDAAYSTAHDYPGGTDSLGPRIGMSGAILRGKVNPADTSHHLRLDEAMKLMAMTADHRILVAMCEELGYLPPIPRVDFAVSDSALLETYTKLMSELGDFSREFHTSLADGVLTTIEVDRMQQEMLQFFSAGEELLSRARQIVQD